LAHRQKDNLPIKVRGITLNGEVTPMACQANGPTLGDSLKNSFQNQNATPNLAKPPERHSPEHADSLTPCAKQSWIPAFDRASRNSELAGFVCKATTKPQCAERETNSAQPTIQAA
jgi:hypothetical protein